MANRCSKIIAVSNSVASRLVAIGIEPAKIRVIYNAVSVPRVTDDKVTVLLPGPKRGRRIFLVAAAALRWSKGIDLAVEATKRVDAQLYVAGDATGSIGSRYKEQLVRAAREGGIEDRVTFLGYRPDIQSVMCEADAVIVPSRCREGFGLTAAEAMALGRPIIVSNRGALPEIAEGGCAAWIFNPDLEGDLERCMNEVIRAADAARVAAEGDVERVRRRFGYPRWASEVAQVFEEARPESSP